MVEMSSELLFTGAGLLLGSFLLYRFVFSDNSSVRKNKSRKFPPPLPPAGPSLSVFGKEAQSCRLARKQIPWAQQYGTVYTIFSPFTAMLPNICLVGDVAVAKQLLVAEQSARTFTSRDEKVAWATRQGEGASITGMPLGEEWKWRKMALLKEFHKRRLGDSQRGLLPQVVRTSHALCDRLLEATKTQKPVQVDLITTQIVIDVILFFMFGRSIDFDPKVFRDSAQTMLEVVFHCAMNPFHFVLRYLPWTKCYAMDRRRDAAWKAVDDIIRPELNQIIQEIDSQPTPKLDRMPGSAMASLLSTEPRFRAGGMDSLLADARVFVLAGFETTAHGLSFAFGLLATHPEIANQIAKEGMAVWDLLESDSADEIQDALDQAPTARLFFAECIRLYPLVPTLPGAVLEDVTVTTRQGDVYGLPQGTQVLFTNMVLNRQEGGDKVNLNRPPEQEQFFNNSFNTGTHVCPGKALSLLEAHIFLLMAAAKFEFFLPPSPDDNDEAETKNHMDFMDHVLLKPKEGMPLIVKQRI